MSKTPVLLLIVLTLAACTARQTPAPRPAGDPSTTEEQAVYAAALTQLYTASSFVIMQSTSTDAVGVDNTGQTLDYVLKNMHDVAADTTESFRSRNSSANIISAKMDLGVAYAVLTEDQRNQIFGQNQSGWEVFYQNYPNTPGITSLSRAGFNAGYDQALVYVGTESNWLAGAGYYLLLKKTDGKWVIDQKVMTWIS